jgi:hypothetical protein
MFVNPEQLPLQDDEIVWVNEKTMRYLVYSCKFPIMTYRTKTYGFRKTTKLEKAISEMPLLTRLQSLW